MLLLLALLSAGEMVLAGEADVAEEIVVVDMIYSCGSPCAGAPDSRYGRPHCDDYDYETALVEAVERGDQSALPMLVQRYEAAGTYQQRHELAGALLGRVDDRKIWQELSAVAAIVVRFPGAGDRATPEFAAWCEERGLEPHEHWWMAQEAFVIVAKDRRARPLLLQGLAGGDPVVIHAAIAGFAAQREERMLPEIDRTLAALPENDQWAAFQLHLYRSPAADAIAEKYLNESDMGVYWEERDR